MTPWFVQIKEGERALVAFPHAGGGPSSLTGLAEHFPPEVGLWAVNLPGRQARLAEPPRTDLDGLVDDLARDLAGWREPYTLFGYCSGALLAYLVCRRVVELGGAPERLVVASFAAPDITPLLRRLPSLPSWLFWEQLIDLGGVPRAGRARGALAGAGAGAARRLRAAGRLPAPGGAAAARPRHGPVRDPGPFAEQGRPAGLAQAQRAPAALRPLDSTHWLAEETPVRWPP
nr:hypothetical protein GCM10020093_017920 [Planobispora longispora]